MYNYECATLCVINEQGSVLVFLDAHVGVTDGWLPPLLTAIADDRSVIATPHVNWIEPSDFAYREIEYSSRAFIGLNWFLNFTWYTPGTLNAYKTNPKDCQLFANQPNSFGVFQVTHSGTRNPPYPRQPNATHSNRNANRLRHCGGPRLFLRNRFVRCEYGNLGWRKSGNGSASMDFTCIYHHKTSNLAV